MQLFMIILILSILVSGCTGEKRIDPVPLHNDTVDVPSSKPDLQHQKVNKSEISVNLSSRRTTILLADEIELELISLSNIYARDNRDINGHNISERYFTVYNFSIKNTGSKAFDLRSDEFNLSSGERIFKQISPEPGTFGWFGLSDRPEFENKINDTTLLPGQTIRGSVIFSVNLPYDRSFLLKHKTTPINISSLEKSLEALTTAELFNYSTAIGKPPYFADRFEPPYDRDTYNPPEADYYSGRNIAYPLIWSNWVNRSIVEFYNRLDSAELNRFRNTSDPPMLSTVFSSKVIPEINITMLTGGSIPGVRLIDDKGEAIIDKSRFKGNGGIAIRNGNTYTIQQPENGSNIDIKRVTFSDATVVHITFGNYYGWSMATRLNYNDQIVIFDENLNIIAVIYDYAHMVT